MTTVWSGALQPKKKQELQDIALALAVDSNGTKDEIHERIKVHLATNPSLASDDRFAGLYSRRKSTRSVKEHEASPSADEGHMVTRRNITRAGSGIFPSPEPLRKRIAHEEYADPNTAVVATPARTSSPVRSVIDSIKRNLPTRPESDAVARVVEEQTRIVVTEADKAFHTSRVFLSNAKNISYLTMWAEFLYGAYHFIPWKYWVITTDSLMFRPAPTHVGDEIITNTRYIQIPVVPSYWLQTPWPYTTAIFWAIPTVILPMIAGHLVSFRTSSNVRRHHAAGEPDPLTMAIVRIALVFVSGWSVPWDHLGLDGQLRLILACLSGAFALSEALGERKEPVHHRAAPVHHNTDETAVALRKKPVATATPLSMH